jgi:hypothetical protein
MKEEQDELENLKNYSINQPYMNSPVQIRSIHLHSSSHLIQKNRALGDKISLR